MDKRLILSIFAFMFFINFVTALEFDNVKSIQEITFDGKTPEDISLLEKYKPLEIQNLFGFGSVLWEGYISEHTENCGEVCYSNIKIRIDKEGSLVDEIRFYTVNKNKEEIEQGIRNYKLYIKTGEEEIDVEDYEWICNPTGIGNQTSCTNEIIGSHKEIIPIWEDYNLGDKLPSGDYEIKLEGEKRPDRDVDWQIKTQGEWTTDWADWIGVTSFVVANYTGGTGGREVYLTHRSAQSFTPISNGSVNNASFKAYRQGTVGTLQLSIYAVDVNDKPTGSVLSYGTLDVSSLSTDSNGVWTWVGMSNYNLINGTRYSLVANLSNGDASNWVAIKTDDTPATYEGGQYHFSIDSGSSWSNNSDIDYNFNVTILSTQGVVTLISPESNYISSDNSINFNCSAELTGGSTLTNISLYSNESGALILNQTNTSVSGLTSGSSTFTQTYPNGQIALWTCEACDSDGDCGFAGENRTFTIDTSPPSITIITPVHPLDYGYLNKSEDLNWTITESNLDSIWYNYNLTNISVFGATNSTNFSIDRKNGNNLTLYANDSAGNLGSKTINWNYTLFQNVENHPDPVQEGSDQTFYINVTNLQSTLTPYLIYDGSSNLGNFIKNGSEFYINKTITIPTINESVNKTFFWSFLMADSSIINSTSQNLTVNNFSIDNCSVNTVEILNLTLKDENNNSFLQDGSSNVEIEIDIYSLDNILISEFNQQFAGNSNITICVENLTNSNYYLYSTIGFSVDNYVNEFYFIDKAPLNNSTIPYNISLMDLLATDSTSFLFNFFDSNGLVIYDPIIQVWRKYIGDGIFREVERSKQNEDGDTIIHLVEEDVIYYFKILQNNTVVYTSNTYTALCQSSPCEISLQEGGGFQDFDNTNWDLIDDGAYSITADPLTREVNLTFSTGTASTFNLTIYELNGSGDFKIVGSGETTGTEGTISITVPNANGNISFFGVIEKDNEHITSKWIDFEEDASVFFGTGLSVFLGLLIVLCLGLMAISEGSGTIVFIILGMIITIILGLIDYRTTIGFGLLIYFILTGGIIVWKLTRRNR